MKVYDLVCILSAMPEHELYIMARLIEEVQLKYDKRNCSNLTLRGGTNNEYFNK